MANKVAVLQVSGVGQFPVFTGLPRYINRAECSMIPGTAIPPGEYWIVDRPVGGWRSKLSQFGRSLHTRHNYSHWFALYRKDGVIDDYMTIFLSDTDMTYPRGNFRMHPLRPNGNGESEGCITFYQHADFYTVREALLSVRHRTTLPGDIEAYGELVVTGRTGKPCTVWNRDI